VIWRDTAVNLAVCYHIWLKVTGTIQKYKADAEHTYHKQLDIYGERGIQYQVEKTGGVEN